uniref:Uncharacterized protein n=1 Tax=Pararge aegeria TaxID=116150 RepID=S4PSJ6_9NEOP
MHPSTLFHNSVTLCICRLFIIFNRIITPNGTVRLRDHFLQAELKMDLSMLYHLPVYPGKNLLNLRIVRVFS